MMANLRFMTRIRNHLAAYAVASSLASGLCAPALAQSTAEDGERLATLFTELAEPGREDWTRVEREINRIWSRSGSPAMDMLLRRGSEAMEAEDHRAAIEHLTALTDHAPDFAEGWNARATAFYVSGEYALAIADIEHRAIRVDHVVTHRSAVQCKIVAELAGGAGDQNPHQSACFAFSGCHQSRWVRYQSTVCSSP